MIQQQQRKKATQQQMGLTRSFDLVCNESNVSEKLAPHQK